MLGLGTVEAVILLLVAVLALTALARNVLVPYPILLVLGGLAISVVPGVPAVPLDPDWVFLVFLPPILWSAAYFTSLRDFRANLRPISLLAIGLVLVTTGAVAAVAHWLLPGIGWPAAIALGAIVSPPDAVAATAVGRRLTIPRRVMVVLEGESLVNDASALVLYRAAVAAVVTGHFVLRDTVLQFLLAAAGGIAIGLVVGALSRHALAAAPDSFTATLVTLLAPYAAWVAGERLHVSAVLACVTGGFYIRRYFSEVVAPVTRIQSRAVWEVLVFGLNGVIFILIGLQLAALRATIEPGELIPLLAEGAVISGVAIAIRLIWVPLAAVLPRALSPGLRRRDPLPPWPAIFLLAWMGMRGIVSLAAALALPLRTASGAPFPYREEIILLTFEVILGTLVVQGLSLAPILRRLRLPEDQSLAEEEYRAREAAAEAALERITRLGGEAWVVPAHVDQLRTRYTQLRAHASSVSPGGADGTVQDAAAFRRLRHEALTAERKTLVELRDRGAISDEVLHRLEQELDADAVRIGTGELPSI
jgi:CPA1 family monovalent cation:H+ antiporter